MDNQECPVCGKYTFNFRSGDYDHEENGTVGAKLTPDEGDCQSCGFFYEEHINYPMSKQATDFIELHPEDGGQADKEEKDG